MDQHPNFKAHPSLLQQPGQPTGRPSEQNQHGQYSWNGIMEFIKESEQRASEREQLLVAEKKLLEEKVEKLSQEVKVQKAQNDELIKKLRIMEFSMRQFKKKGPEEAPKQVKKVVRHQRGNSDGVQAFIPQRLKLLSNHAKNSSGSSQFGHVKTIEDEGHLDRTMELYGEHAAKLSQTFHQQPAYHQKTESSDKMDSSATLASFMRQKEPKKIRQKSNGQIQGLLKNIPEMSRQEAALDASKLSTKAKTSKVANPTSQEVGQRRKWVKPKEEETKTVKNISNLNATQRMPMNAQGTKVA